MVVAAMRESEALSNVRFFHEGLMRHYAPGHVAIIPDGNGRWATARGKPREWGHASGVSALLDVVDGALQIGISWLTVYGFSSENWSRPKEEVRFLMRLHEHVIRRYGPYLQTRDVQVRFAGRRENRMPLSLLRAMGRLEHATAQNRALVLILALNYGGRAEIVDAVRTLADGRKASEPVPDTIDEATLRQALYHPDAPDPDLIVRTGGERRLSNLLLWQVAYAELHFCSAAWPDFRREHLFAAVTDFGVRQRRFGSRPATFPEQALDRMPLCGPARAPVLSEVGGR
jgi:undecaprenyl diphosphate synthase